MDSGLDCTAMLLTVMASANLTLLMGQYAWLWRCGRDLHSAIPGFTGGNTRLVVPSLHCLLPSAQPKLSSGSSDVTAFTLLKSSRSSLPWTKHETPDQHIFCSGHTSSRCCASPNPRFILQRNHKRGYQEETGESRTQAARGRGSRLRYHHSFPSPPGR